MRCEVLKTMIGRARGQPTAFENFQASTEPAINVAMFVEKCATTGATTIDQG